MNYCIPVRELSTTDRLKQLEIPPTEAEITDWVELTETIVLLDAPAIRNWMTALGDRFGNMPQARADFWSRLSLDCRNSLKAAKGGVA